jgi:hypothetical protein
MIPQNHPLDSLKTQRSCSRLLVGDNASWRLDNMSNIAAVLYTALFSTVGDLVGKFRSSNPTWLKPPSSKSERLGLSRNNVENSFLASVDHLAHLLSRHADGSHHHAPCEINNADATSSSPKHRVDCIITSPPYCTRIDYTVATRVELAILSKLVPMNLEELGSKMIGTTKVPKIGVRPSVEWGSECLSFLESVRSHRSKASAGYYYKTHVDYFDKMARSISLFSSSLRTGGTAAMIVQDSYYKDIHNDVPSILAQMATSRGLILLKKSDFTSTQSISRINSRARRYGTSIPVESVMCFAK